MVFMIEKSLMIIIFMYIFSFSLLTVEYVYAQPFGITLTSPDGKTALDSPIKSIINLTKLNSVQLNSTSITRPSVVSNPVTAAAGLAWDIFQIVTGTYIFNILILIGAPSVFVAGIVIVYVILMIRTLIGYMRGI